MHNGIRLWKYREAVRPRCCRRVRPLRSFGLLPVRQGMLRTGAMRILLRLSRDPFMREGFLADEAPTCPHRVSPSASSLCGIATSFTGWHAPGRGARPLSLHFVANPWAWMPTKVKSRLVHEGSAALARGDRSKDYAAPLRSEFTEMFQALSSHSGT